MKNSDSNYGKKKNYKKVKIWKSSYTECIGTLSEGTLSTKTYGNVLGEHYAVQARTWTSFYKIKWNPWGRVELNQYNKAKGNTI